MFGQTPLYISAFAFLAGHAAAHGMVTSPPIRSPGAAFQAACGQQVYNTVKSDPYGNIQQEAQVSKGQKDFDAAQCNLNMCKGIPVADMQASDVQRFTRGQTVPFVVDIRAPHTGTANMTIVRSATGEVLGGVLKSWSVYASNSAPISKDDTNFSITIPADLDADACKAVGDCHVRWLWDSRMVDQTYENCVDMVVTG
ncbi:hypothetical protein P8C59_008347 [Phyllachora maydis]|uniref:Chitin-binding type-4 domain-containing protein n=1 Tax=Phyllachora maydis TaxID=1825666 RepID=A0AAD9MJM2_9PEZI|nr:hypothetical protein P8C59_008347 [Phyllachora maydis]